MAHTVTITNTGNVKLRGITISTTVTQGPLATAVTSSLSLYNCTGGSDAALPTALNVSSVMVCTATYTFAAVQDIEAGNLLFASTVSATQLDPATVQAVPATQNLTVVNAPSITLQLNASACDKPSTAGK